MFSYCRDGLIRFSLRSVLPNCISLSHFKTPQSHGLSKSVHGHKGYVFYTGDSAEQQKLGFHTRNVAMVTCLLLYQCTSLLANPDPGQIFLFLLFFLFIQ